MTNDFDKLVAWLKSRGHGHERAQQIAGNHADAVRAEMEKYAKEKTAGEKESTPTPPAEPNTTTEQEGAIPQAPQAEVRRRRG